MNGKQLLKLFVILLPSYGISHALLYLSEGTAAPVFDEILSSFLVVATLLSTLSAALFAYIDSISKELTELRNEVDRNAYTNVIEKISALKKEILYNGALIAGLFLLERSIKGVTAYLLTHLPIEQVAQVTNISSSFRMSLFCIALAAASTQFKGFLVAINYRDLIAKNKK